MIENFEKVTEKRKLEQDAKRLREENLKRVKENVVFINNELSKFVNNPNYSQYKFLLEGLKEDYINRLCKLNEQNLILEYGKLVGKIELLTDILELPKTFKKALENIAKGEPNV